MSASDLRRLERSTRELARAKRAWKQAIVLARESGESYKDISASAGFTAERARQICIEDGADQPKT